MNDSPEAAQNQAHMKKNAGERSNLQERFMLELSGVTGDRKQEEDGHLHEKHSTGLIQKKQESVNLLETLDVNIEEPCTEDTTNYVVCKKKVPSQNNYQINFHTPNIIHIPALTMPAVGSYKDVLNEEFVVPQAVIRTVAQARACETMLKQKVNELQNVRMWLWLKQAGIRIFGVVGGVFTFGAATVAAAGGSLRQRNHLQQVKRALRQALMQINELCASEVAATDTWTALPSPAMIEESVFTRGIDRAEL